MSVAIRILSKIEEIRDYLKVTNSPAVKSLEFLPKLKMIRGINLESGVNSLVFGNKTELGPLRVTFQNYTIKNEIFCTNNCDNGNLTIEITPKTYGFVVKILDEEFKNLQDGKATFVSFISNSDEHYGLKICESSSTFPQ